MPVSTQYPSMVLESHETRTETFGDFIVAGVAHRGTAVDRDALWAEFERMTDDLGGKTIGRNRYGVYFDIDEDDGEFTYVAGVPVDSVDDLPPEMTNVEIPEATYAVFSTDVDAVDEVTVDIHNQEFGNVDHDHEVGVLVEQYETDVNPAHRDTALEFYVPLLDEDET